jgi:hypothetical protein
MKKFLTYILLLTCLSGWGQDFILKYGNTILRNGNSIISYYWDSDALAYFARMTTPPSSEFKQRVNAFIIAQKASGLWEKKRVIVLLQAETQQAATLNMIKDSFNATFVNSPTWVANDGFTADVGYVNTNFNPYVNGGIYTQNSAGVAIYIKTNVFTARYDYGARTTVPLIINIVFMSFTTGSRSTMSINEGTATTSAASSVTTSIGVFALRRTASNLYKAYQNGVEYSSQTTASTGLSNVNIYIGCYNNDGTPSLVSGRKFGYYEITSGLTPSEELINYNQLKTLLQIP